MSRQKPSTSKSEQPDTLVIEQDSEDLIAKVISGPVRGAAGKIDGIVIGRLVHCGGVDGGVFHVDYKENPSGQPIEAVSTAALRDRDIGEEVALAFESGNPLRPIVLGRIHRSRADAATPASIEGEADGETLTFTADKQIVLRCGKASITLTRAGKILIRGANVLSRSSGANRVKGGSVQIN